MLRISKIDGDVTLVKYDRAKGVYGVLRQDVLVWYGLRQAIAQVNADAIVEATEVPGIWVVVKEG